MDARRIAVIEDEATIAASVAARLRAEGFEVEVAEDGPAGVELCRSFRPDLIVLDLMLPGIDGLEVCRRLRARSDVPVIMLTALGAETDRVMGLELGADDYVGKPFSPRELALRVDSVLRRSGGPSSDVPALLTDGPLVIDSDRHVATRAGEPLALTAREFDLLRFLVAHPGTAYTREDLLQHVWGWTIGDRSTVTVHVRRLREKVEDDPRRPERLLTVWGVGYRWEASS
jgi:DNA-binding response OmpR family regulator